MKGSTPLSVATRKEKEKLERRNAILVAAKDLFYDKGYQNTTVGEIAEAAHLSKGTVYLYFASKDELYVTVVLESFQAVEESLHEIMGSDLGIREKGRAFYLAFVEHCMKNREYFRMTQYFLTENARENLPGELIETVSAHTSGLLEYVAGLVTEGKETELIRDDVDPYMFAVIAWRSATGLLDLAVIGDSAGAHAGPFPKLFEQAIDLLIEGAAGRR
jgi:AcrR family transcriptional regulator